MQIGFLVQNRVMPRPSKGERSPRTVRFPVDWLARMDQARGSQPLDDWLLNLVAKHLDGRDAEKMAAAPVLTAAPEPPVEVTPKKTVKLPGVPFADPPASKHDKHPVVRKFGKPFCTDCGEWV